MYGLLSTTAVNRINELFFSLKNIFVEFRKKYGKNAILKGMNLEEGATAMDRNRQIGGHKA